MENFKCEILNLRRYNQQQQLTTDGKERRESGKGKVERGKGKGRHVLQSIIDTHDNDDCGRKGERAHMHKSETKCAGHMYSLNARPECQDETRVYAVQ